MRGALRRVVVGSYLLWLLVVVLLVLGRHTPFPLFDTVRSGVVFGTAVLTVVGSVQLLQAGYRRFTG